VHRFPLDGLLEALQFPKLVPLPTQVFKCREFLGFEFQHLAAFLKQDRLCEEIGTDTEVSILVPCKFKAAVDVE